MGSKRLSECIIQGDQKVSVHLMITIQKEVHRDFLITLYYKVMFECCIFIPYLMRHRLSYSLYVRYLLYVRYFLNSTITNMAMVRNFMVLSSMFR